MPTLEERVAYLEGRLGFRFAIGQDLRTSYREFRGDSSLSDLRTEWERSRTALREEFRRLGDTLDSHFRWLMALQVTTLLVIGGAVVGLYFK